MYHPLFDTLKHELEYQRTQLFLWLPVFFGGGVGFYFFLPQEPPLFLGIGIFALALSIFIVFREWPKFHVLSLIGMIVCAGFMMSCVRAHLVYTPILEKKLGPVEVIGTIAKIEKLEAQTGTRVTLEDLFIEELPPEKMPRKVRLRVRQDQNLNIGARVKVLAELQPASMPVIPDGFDFRRYLYFQSIGAVGFVYNEPEIVKAASGTLQNVESLSASITKKIQDDMDAGHAGIAVALITGQQTGISQEDLEAVRASGLAHMLSISGLHIGLFSGLIFFVVRGLLALIPGFALRHPIKKYAAVVAFVAAFFYLAISGFQIPAQRSLIMAGVVFLAIICDRTALSLRLVALAALAVLIMAPESLLSASFQMSFGAVVCLIVFFEAIRDWWSAQYRTAGPLKKAAFYFLSISMTTVIATFGTAPFSVFHFQQFSSYGLLANFVAIPILGFIIMPLAIVALFAMPLGLDSVPLQLMAYPIQWILDVAYWVAGLPYAILRMPMIPTSALILCVLGALIIFLWRGYGRWAGAALVMISIVLSMVYKRADILVSDGGDLWAYIDGGGILHVSARNKDRFAIESWERVYAMEEGSASRWPQEGVLDQDGSHLACGEFACRLEHTNYKISFLKHPGDAVEECSWADLVLSSDPLPHSVCSDALVIDKFDTHDEGAHAAWLRSSGIQIKSSLESVGRRLWSPDYNARPNDKSASATPAGPGF